MSVPPIVLDKLRSLRGVVRTDTDLDELNVCIAALEWTDKECRRERAIIVANYEAAQHVVRNLRSMSAPSSQVTKAARFYGNAVLKIIDEQPALARGTLAARGVPLTPTPIPPAWFQAFVNLGIVRAEDGAQL